MTLMIETPGDLVWDLACVLQASYLEGDPLLWILPLYLHINKKSDDDDDLAMLCITKVYTLLFCCCYNEVFFFKPDV